MSDCAGVAQRLKRDPMRFDILDLFDAVGRSRKYVLGSAEDKAEFIQLVDESLTEANTDSMIYGRRTEAMFAYIAASLGKCLLIKKEDTGDVFSNDVDILLPDYRLVLADGSQMMVEVKNYRQRSAYNEYSVKTEYLDRVLRYAHIVNTDLYFAIYWSKWGMWTLVSADDFQRSGNCATLSFETAMKRNSMIRLGDALIGTTAPLSIRIYPSKEESHRADSDGKLEFIMDAVEMHCNQSIITDENEKRIALALMLFGNWRENSRVYYSDAQAKEIDYIEFSYCPEEYNGEQEVALVDSISTIISRQYGQLTAPAGKVECLTPSVAPGMLGVVIPEPYHSDALPLWILHQEPNYE